MKPRLKEINDSRTWKLYRYENVMKLCCSPHTGCNKMHRGTITCWKDYRKTQYKN